MIMEGSVRALQDGKCIFEAKNHLTALAAKYLLSYMLGNYIQAGYNSSNSRYTYAYMMGSAYRIKLGKGSVQPSFSVTALSSWIIDTPSNSLNAITDYAVGGPFDIIYTGVIPAQTLSTAFGVNQVCEMGLECYGAGTPTTYKWILGTISTNTSNYTSYFLAAYISSYGATPDFDPDDIDVTKALTVEWRLRVAWASD